MYEKYIADKFQHKKGQRSGGGRKDILDSILSKKRKHNQNEEVGTFNLSVSKTGRKRHLLEAAEAIHSVTEEASLKAESDEKERTCEVLKVRFPHSGEQAKGSGGPDL